eukprot:6400631-Alexandrium_andersonii.AAC.1
MINPLYAFSNLIRLKGNRERLERAAMQIIEAELPSRIFVNMPPDPDSAARQRSLRELTVERALRWFQDCTPGK